MVERFCSAGIRGVAITAATSSIAGHLAQLLSEQGIAPSGLVRGTPGRVVSDPSLWRAVVGTSDPGWANRLQRAAGRSLDVVLDCVGGWHAVPLMEQLAPAGVLVHYGLLSGEPLPAECFERSDGKRVEMFRLREAVHSHPRRELPQLFQPVFDRMRSGRLLTRPARRVPLSALPEALRDDGEGGAGNVLVECQRESHLGSNPRPVGHRTTHRSIQLCIFSG